MIYNYKLFLEYLFFSPPPFYSIPSLLGLGEWPAKKEKKGKSKVVAARWLREKNFSRGKSRLENRKWKPLRPTCGGPVNQPTNN